MACQLTWIDQKIESMLSHSLNEIKGRIIPLSKDRPLHQIDKLIISEKAKIHFIEYQQILFCEADSNYTIIHLRGGKKITASKCLKDIQGVINSPDFYRIHSKYLINIQHLNCLEKKRQWYANLFDHSLAVSRDRIDGLKSYLNI